MEQTLIKTQPATVIDSSVIRPGYAIYAKNYTWDSGRTGFVTSVTDDMITVQYYPGIGNVTNHFFIKADQIAAGHWDVRWSADLSEVSSITAEME